MDRKLASHAHRLLVTAVFTTVVLPHPAGATPAVVRPTIRSPGVLVPSQPIKAGPTPAARWHPHPIGPHVFYGTITAIRGTAIRVQLRNGRSANVDASAAIANGDYSGPLFVGKLVCIDGNVNSAGLFTAAHVFRLTNLSNLRPDK